MCNIAVVGIGTDVAKTVVSAIIVEALGADYWKPIQSGSTESSDRKTIASLVTSKNSTFHSEVYSFQAPLSPHYAAFLEGITIDPKKVSLPKTSKPLVIEGSGGLLVPINKESLMIDLFSAWNCKWILVSKHYLGSINHTLLTLECLLNRGLKVDGIVFFGDYNLHLEEPICNFYTPPNIFRLFPEKELTPKIIQTYAETWKPQLKTLL